MRYLVAAILLMSWRPSAARAAFTGFEDLAPSDTFNVGAVFQSEDIHFRVVQLQAVDNPVQVGGGVNGLGLGLVVGPGVEFQLPPGMTSASLHYSDGASSVIEINGFMATAAQSGFSFLNGTSLGGVSIATSVIRQSVTMLGSQPVITFEVGLLALTGALDALSIAGVELSIDNVLIIPEPTSASMCLTGLVALKISRGRRK